MIRYEQAGRVAVISYDRQERRNAWSVAMYDEIVAAVERANGADEVGAIVITNEGPTFCAGTDLKASQAVSQAGPGGRTLAKVSMAQDQSWLHLLARSKPTIGAIRGAAIGLGVTHILPFDIRLGGASSSYAFPFLRLSVMPELGCTAFLPRLVGYGQAVRICLTAASLDAEEALRLGLISAIYADDEVLPQAIAMGEAIASYAPLQVELTRRLLQQNSAEVDANLVLQREVDAFVAMFRARKAGDARVQSRT